MKIPISSSLLLFITAFVSGLAVMAVELSGTRLLAPYFGTSLYVWTNVIGLIMLALAGGYFFGGILADRAPRLSVYYFIIFATGIWVLFIPFIAAPLFGFLSHGLGELASVVRFGSFVAVAILFIVPMFLLGMIVPFTVKLLLARVEQAGRVSGRVSMVSTVGSLVGTFLPAFVLIPIFGTTRSFVLLGCLLLVLSSVGLKKVWLFILAILSSGLFWMVPPVYADDAIIISQESPYGFIFVTQDEDGLRRLHVDQALGSQSIYDPSGTLLPERYYYSYFALLPTLIENPKEVLILGHAGGSFTRILNEFYPDLKVTGVEIDPAVTEIAMESMGLEDLNVEIIHADARSFLINSQNLYDLILIDTYHNASIPSHLATQEFFSLTKSRLSAGGVLALNIAAADSDFLDTLINTFADEFELAARYAVPGSFNTMVFGQESSSFKWSAPPPSLENLFQSLLTDMNGVTYYSSHEIFIDEKPTRVDILTEQMLMNLYESF